MATRDALYKQRNAVIEEVWRRQKRGETAAQIARALGISRWTVQSYYGIIRPEWDRPMHHDGCTSAVKSPDQRIMRLVGKALSLGIDKETACRIIGITGERWDNAIANRSINKYVKLSDQLPASLRNKLRARALRNEEA